MRQLGSAILAVIIMLTCAALSEQFIPAVASHEASPSPLARVEGTVMASNASALTANAAPARLLADETDPDVPPRIPEQLVMLLAGIVLMGLGGALRTPQRER